MKPAHLITLAITLIIALLYFAYDSGSKSSPAEQSGDRQTNVSPDDGTTPSRSSTRKLSRGKLTSADWDQVASDLKNLSRQLDKFKPSPALEKRLRQYSKSELISALYSVRLEDLEVRDKVNLNRYLLTLIVQLDPADFCRDPYAASLSPLSRPYWERFALAEWVRLSPEDATAWRDSLTEDSHKPKQITALEHNLFSALIVVDFEQAKARYLATPEEQRHRMMQNFDGFGSFWTGDDFQNHNLAGRFAELARLHGTKQSEDFIAAVISGRGEQDRPAAISRIQDSLHDWKKGNGTWLPATTVADYLDKIDATPREQELCIESNVYQFRYYNRDGDLDAFRKKFTAEVSEIRSKN